jgi:predicted ATPase
VPPPGRKLSIDAIANYASVRLFVDRASSINPAFALRNDNADAVAALCARLDGLPLALELAAARTKMLPPALLLQRLDSAVSGSALRLLTRGVAVVCSLADRHLLAGHAARAEVLFTWALDLSEHAPKTIEIARGRGRASAGLANSLRLRGRYREAEFAALNGIDEISLRLGANDPGLVPLLNSLGIIYKYTSAFDRG